MWCTSRSVKYSVGRKKLVQFYFHELTRVDSTQLGVQYTTIQLFPKSTAMCNLSWWNANLRWWNTNYRGASSARSAWLNVITRDFSYPLLRNNSLGNMWSN